MTRLPDIDLSTADRLHERALAALPGGNTRTTVFVPPRPPYAVRGEGCELIDSDGRRVLDLLNNYTALVHGHARAELVEAAVDAVRGGSCFGLPTEHEIELAERLRARIPSAERWRFANSGTEAVMMAIRLARAATGRSAVLRFQGAYHGSYDAAMQPPARGVPASVEEEVVTVEVGDRDGLEEALAEYGPRLACVLFDAMPNRAGLRPATPEFARALREQTRRYGVLLVQDEVITLRLSFGGLQERYGIEPDITTVGKLVGGGFPIGGVGGREELMSLFDPRRPDAIGHGGTFNANPVSMRAGAVSLDLLTAEEIARINALGNRLRESLAERGWDVSGDGSLLKVRAPDQEGLWWSLYAEGVLIAAQGLIAISTAMDETSIDRALAAFDRVGGGAR
ncbi:MAG TPA: aminotransferase class III-fold pyridoxal phosphate-dependent enzyme [Solirubrobacteraceae bacterium]|jgi:glutamate-1-semialdehyde 2,1-aminomutase